jgi:hypothetical protein
MLTPIRRYFHWVHNLWMGMWTGYDFNEAERQLAALRVRFDASEQEALLAFGAVIWKLNGEA